MNNVEIIWLQKIQPKIQIPKNRTSVKNIFFSDFSLNCTKGCRNSNKKVTITKAIRTTKKDIQKCKNPPTTTPSFVSKVS